MVLTGTLFFVKPLVATVTAVSSLALVIEAKQPVEKAPKIHHVRLVAAG